MAAVIAQVLARNAYEYPSDFTARATRAAQTLLPAVLTLNRLADRLGRDANAQDTSWRGGLSGLIHRRCRLAPAHGDARNWPAPEPTTHPSIAPVESVSLARTNSRGWELIRCTAVVRQAGLAWESGVRVVHDLARRTTASARTPGVAVPASALPPIRMLTLNAGDLCAWARATADNNPIHLHAGAALNAGMAVEEDEIVAHGLLLGAVSLALVPAAGTVDLRLTGAVRLPLNGTAALCAHTDGSLTAGGSGVLARR
ncbi:MaoC/PaaZ C-terminal domain-containing protein [Actinomyces qiguomingii]|uniref:MaoC/PaaZ C-terminal domain-containing protein n=1 Tax=Actinomyces qiguomingii TaxID=2057800 RepID=UPI000CA0846D|nr:MaoC/PaaZ C-terminal domain-containing protein [Actinomyces qiguomingii]